MSEVYDDTWKPYIGLRDTEQLIAHLNTNELEKFNGNKKHTQQRFMSNEDFLTIFF